MYNRELENFIVMSKYAGMREDLVQAGGGNSSYKISEQKMLIKASGYQMADISYKDGYAVVNPSLIRQAFWDTEKNASLTEKDSSRILKGALCEGQRPSIETFLHSITKKYTLHVHPISVNILTCRKDGKGIISELFPEAPIVPYAKPGIELAKKYFEAYREWMDTVKGDIDIVFLENHGLLATADSADMVITLIENVTKKIEKYLGLDFSAYRNATKIWKLFPDKIVWTVTDKNVLNTYQENGIWPHTFCPDCIVFLGKRFLEYTESTSSDDIERFMDRNGEPAVIAAGDSLYVLASSVKQALEVQSVLSFSAQVMAANHGVNCNLLSDAQQNELLDWDAEKYRKNMR